MSHQEPHNSPSRSVQNILLTGCLLTVGWLSVINAPVTAGPLSDEKNTCAVLLPEGGRNYHGACRNGLAHGEGRVSVPSRVDPNGEYRGQFVDGALHGQAAFIFAGGKSQAEEYFLWGRQVSRDQYLLQTTNPDDFAPIRDMEAALAKRRAEEKTTALPSWQRAQSANTLSAYRDYIRANPGSPFIKEAFAALYARVKASQNVTAFAEYLREFPDAPEYAQAKVDMLKAAGLESRYTFRQGKIGERYVPGYSESRYSTQTYTVNGQTYTESRRTGDANYGGYSTDRYGYTAVFQLFNESRQPYVVRVKLSGTSSMSETYVHESSWTGNKSHQTSTSAQRLAREQSYLLDADGEVKDQVIAGETQPSDFAIEFVEIVPVSAAWLADLRRALDGKGDLKLIARYLEDDRASAWHGYLRERFTDVAKKGIGVQITPGRRFDPDFDSPVSLTFSNSTGMAVLVSYKPNFGGSEGVTLEPGKSHTVQRSAKGVSRERLGVEITTVALPEWTSSSRPSARVSNSAVQGVEARRKAAEALAEEYARLADARVTVENRILQRERWKRAKPGEVIKDCNECPDMVVIPAGSFEMGSPSSEPERQSNEGPVRTVHVPGFAMGRTEVTQRQWQAVMGSNPSFRKNCDECPVEQVSWEDVQEYIRKLNERTGQAYRLPSEAEWEYAARAVTTTRFNTGDCVTSDQANFNGTKPAQGCPEGMYRQVTLPVGSFAPNHWGLHDMHGNVMEWTQDCWNDSHSEALSDGSARGDGDCSRRVVRGGGWVSGGGWGRSAHRFNGSRGGRLNSLGFRLAKSR